MNQTDPPRPLTDDELSRLLAPVPLEWQQRDAQVRIALRPGLPADYVGPVELADLRLSLSPWQWLKHELVVTTNTAALNQLLAEAREAGESLDTVAELAQWVDDGPFDEREGRYWEAVNSSDYWGHYGVVSDHYDIGWGSFLPPSFELQEVTFFGETFGEEETPDDIVVVQAFWKDWQGDIEFTGPVSIFAFPKGRHRDRLHDADKLWLTDSSTGETCNLDPDGEWKGAKEDKDDEEESDDAKDWTGQPPGLDHYKSDNTAQNLPVLLTGLRYEAGCLYRADTDALLTLTLKRLEAPGA